MLDKLEKISKSLSALAKEINGVRMEMLGSAEASAAAESSAGSMPSSLAGIGSFLELSPKMNQDLLLTTILRCATYVTGAAGGGLTIFDHQKKMLVFRSAIGPNADRLIGLEVPLEGSVNGLAFASGEVQSTTPIDRTADEITGVVYRNVLVAPLIADGEGVGTITAVNKQNGDHFTAEDMEAYKLFADLAAQVVRQQLREEMVKRMIKGDDVSMAAGLETIRCSEGDALLMKIAKDIRELSKGREDLLPLFQQLTGLMVEISARYRW